MERAAAALVRHHWDGTGCGTTGTGGCTYCFGPSPADSRDVAEIAIAQVYGDIVEAARRESVAQVERLCRVADEYKDRTRKWRLRAEQAQAEVERLEAECVMGRQTLSNYDASLDRLTADRDRAVRDARRDALRTLVEFRETLPTSHHETPGVIRAIEVLTDLRDENGPSDRLSATLDAPGAVPRIPGTPERLSGDLRGRGDV